MRTAILALFLLLMPLVADAQLPRQPDATTPRSVVVQLRAAIDNGPAPVELLDRLALQPHLLELEVTGTDQRQLLTVRFAFSSLSEYRGWRQWAETRRLLQELRAAAGELETTLAVRRVESAAEPVAR